MSRSPNELAELMEAAGWEPDPDCPAEYEHKDFPSGLRLRKIDLCRIEFLARAQFPDGPPKRRRSIVIRAALEWMTLAVEKGVTLQDLENLHK